MLATLLWRNTWRIGLRMGRYAMKEDIKYLEAKEELLKAGWKTEDLPFEPVMYVQGRVYRPDIVLLYNW
jgi:hypothetical protein